jgi:hypothetical protein
MTAGWSTVKFLIFANTLFMKKNIFLYAVGIAISLGGFTQASLPAIDKSPLDICYFPLQYPNLKVKEDVTGDPAIRIIYSRPKKEGRAVFGGLVTYGKLWRLGANEATEIEFYKPVIIGNKKIAKGRYTIYAIVNEKTWTFIINKETDIWGSFKYDPAKDAVRVESLVQPLNEQVESLAMTFEKENSTINLIVAWENIKVALPISL